MVIIILMIVADVEKTIVAPEPERLVNLEIKTKMTAHRVI
jgi:hypothetical protein